VYVACDGGKSVAVVESETHAVVDILPMATGALDVALLPAGRPLYVALPSTDSVAVYPVESVTPRLRRRVLGPLTSRVHSTIVPPTAPSAPPGQPAQPPPVPVPAAAAVPVPTSPTGGSDAGAGAQPAFTVEESEELTPRELAAVPIWTVALQAFGPYEQYSALPPPTRPRGRWMVAEFAAENLSSETGMLIPSDFALAAADGRRYPPVGQSTHLEYGFWCMQMAQRAHSTERRYVLFDVDTDASDFTLYVLGHVFKLNG
jgi:hypothetical protein